MIVRLKNIVLLTITTAAIYAAVGCCSPPQEDRKIVVYQIFTRLFGGDSRDLVVDGELSVNGVGKFEDFTDRALDSIRAMGVTHVWYTGVIEHASIYSVDQYGGVQMNHPDVIKGKAGSPYAIKDYYDVNSYLATSVDDRMEEFEALVRRTHRADMRVIIDFVPNHVARGYHSDMAPKGVVDLGVTDDNTKAFDPNNNFYYIPDEALELQFDHSGDCEPYYEYPAKVTGNDVFSAKPHRDDWYETIKINYGVDYLDAKREYFDPIPDTWHKMLDILLYWSSKGVDGFRCDMAEMTPYQFWGWAISNVKSQYPDMIFIAEIYNPEAYELYIEEGGFDYLYDKVGLYDTLKGVVQGRLPSSAITESRESIAPVQSHMLNFLENHDEQRIAWHEFAGDAAAGLPMMLVSTLSDNIPMMLYFGQELGEVAAEDSGFSGADGRTTIFDFWSVPTYQRWRNGGLFDGGGLDKSTQKLRRDYISILKLAQHTTFVDGEFLDITALNPSASSSLYAFVRYSDEHIALVISNLSEGGVDTTLTLPSELNISTVGRSLYDSSPQNKRSIKMLANGDVALHLAPYQALVVELRQ